MKSNKECISLSELRQDISNSWSFGSVKVKGVMSKGFFRYMVPVFAKEVAKDKAFINKLISNEESPKEAYRILKH